MVGHFMLASWLIAAPLALQVRPPVPAALSCEGPDARWPDNVVFLDDLDHLATRTLRQSETVRRQCREFATAASRIRIRVRLDVRLIERPFRAQSVVHKTVEGHMLALVALAGRGQIAEWIAHEFEHLLEQLEGVCLDTLRRETRSAWLSADRMFESARAIQAGRRALREIAGPR